ncbi:MAG: hypothetical protein FWH20_09165 [Oscillospiraceae bacterium]|nr:hypothetical protein [Oscillospiraceae bacterium]
MQITPNHNDKIVEVWLTNQDKQNTKLRQYLKPLYADYKKQGYTVAVFSSGQSDFLGKTTDLLLKNKANLAGMNF